MAGGVYKSSVVAHMAAAGWGGGRRNSEAKRRLAGSSEGLGRGSVHVGSLTALCNCDEFARWAGAHPAPKGREATENPARIAFMQLRNSASQEQTPPPGLARCRSGTTRDSPRGCLAVAFRPLTKSCMPPETEASLGCPPCRRFATLIPAQSSPWRPAASLALSLIAPHLVSTLVSFLVLLQLVRLGVAWSASMSLLKSAHHPTFPASVPFL